MRNDEESASSEIMGGSPQRLNYSIRFSDTMTAVAPSSHPSTSYSGSSSSSSSQAEPYHDDDSDDDFEVDASASPIHELGEQDGIAQSMTMMNTYELERGWKFMQTDDCTNHSPSPVEGEEDGQNIGWMPVERVPTNVHLDLIANKKISDPFLGFNELDCEWVGEKAWTYRVRIAHRLLVPPKGRREEERQLSHELVFDGLDTFATVKLDGKVILESENMFIPQRVDITNSVREKKEEEGEGERYHLLEICFASALLEARKIRAAHPEHKWVGFNGEMSRLAVRKAQYHWGWDWGPFLMTCGPWRPIRIEMFYARISDLRVDYTVSADLQHVTGSITACIEGPPSVPSTRKIVICSFALADKTVLQQTAQVDADGTATTDFRIDNAELWYPYGYGNQPLYICTATLATCDDEQQQQQQQQQDKHGRQSERRLHTTSRKTGFRLAQLIQEPDRIGKSFFFRINGVDVFCGGSDWIPADSFTPRIGDDKYRAWLKTLVDGYQVMVRVWGGGIWEEDVFYDTCDELGILVWQDFMFGCGNYPAYPTIRKSIEEEAIAQVKRLRHHPSIVIYAGNNEDYQVQEQYNLTYDYTDKNPENWLKTDFPARYIYEKILPEAVAAHSSHVAYHPGSPWGDGLVTSDQTVGDMHQWNVWHGTQEKYQIFDTLGGRFNSEFGMEAFPHIDTIRYFVTDPSQLYQQSRMIDFHNKAAGHERRIATYLVENFRVSTELEAYIHLTQLSQAEALMFGYKGWRRQWGQERRCGGALVWQLNDCWPVTSWSIIDHFLRKKPAYYAMRRTLAPVAIAVKRAHHDWSVVHARPARSSDYECWVASSKTQAITATVELRFLSIATGKPIKDALVKRNVEIIANGTTEIFKGVIDNRTEEPHVLAARIWVDDKVVSRDVDWPQPLKYLDFAERGISVSQKGNRTVVKADKPTKGLVFEEREGVLIDDSALDVVPGDEQIVLVKGLKDEDEPLEWRYYGQ